MLDVVPYKCCPDLLYGTQTFRVTSSRVEGLYSCTCCKFERDGVLCCHILKVFDALAVRNVPNQYILTRWSVELVLDIVGWKLPLTSLFSKHRLQTMGSMLFITVGCAPTLIRL